MRDLNDLSFYAAVVASGGFSAAARELRVPKSRISRRVAALEARLGVRLLGPGGAEAVVAHEPRLSSGEFAVLREGAIDGLGVALLPEYATREPLADGRLERVLPDWGAPQGILHVVFTSRRGLLPGVRAVIDFIAGALDPKSVEWLNPT